MCGAEWNVYGLIFADETDLVVDRHARRSLNDDPVFGAVVVLLK